MKILIQFDTETQEIFVLENGVKKLTETMILNSIIKYFKIKSVEELRFDVSNTKKKNGAIARRFAAYYLDKHLKYTHEKISYILGNKRASITNTIIRFKQLLDCNDIEYKEHYSKLNEILGIN